MSSSPAFLLLPVVKNTLRVKSSIYDAEILMHIETAIAEFERLGIDYGSHPLARAAVVAWVKSQFGNQDPGKKTDWMKTYDRLINQLLMKRK